MLITRQPLDGGFKITPAKSSGRLNPEVTRILAPSPREPWADLADDLVGGMVLSEVAAEAVAQSLHEQGWRKVGDES